MKAIRAIQTEYRGEWFNSMTEARWAVFFDSLGVVYEHEQRGFDFGDVQYLPDFLLKSVRVLHGKNWAKYRNSHIMETPPVDLTRRMDLWLEVKHSNFHAELAQACEITGCGLPMKSEDMPPVLASFAVARSYQKMAALAEAVAPTPLLIAAGNPSTVVGAYHFALSGEAGDEFSLFEILKDPFSDSPLLIWTPLGLDPEAFRWWSTGEYAATEAIVTRANQFRFRFIRRAG